MHCGGCAAKVEKTLAAVDGVKSATVDLPTKSVKVTYDADKLDVDKLKATFTGSLKYSSQLYYPDDAQVSYASFLAEGMHCGGCAAKVKKNMLAEAGVKDVTVCLDTKAVGIAYDSNVTDVSKLIDGFKKMNYEVTECYNN
jgi:copper chaperone CopZ